MTTTHVAPEEVMAWVDGELAESEARTVEAHVEECAECAGVAAGFRRMSEDLAEWMVPEIPARVEAAVMKAAAGAKEHAHGRFRRTWGTRRRWIVGLAGAMALVLALVAIPFPAHKSRGMYMVAPMQRQPSMAPLDQRSPASGVAGLMDRQIAPSATVERKRSDSAAMVASLVAPSPAIGAASAVAAPMIARTVSLAVRVKEVGAARTTLEAMLARHHGYTAQMTASAAEGAPHELQASLRIPAGDLEAALKDLRTLGRVENETQSGEEVTQQHQDLAARLKNSRETEARMQAILEQRTGRLSDVLEVEQEIARVRGEIESMEAEQAGLEHRVDFATVDVSVMEEAKFDGVADSAAARMRDGLVTGFTNARETVVGMVVFGEEYGPAILVWAVVLGLPGIWLWRRYRRGLRAG